MVCVVWHEVDAAKLFLKKKKKIPYCSVLLFFWSASICMLYSSACSHEYGLNTHWENTGDPQLPSDVTTGFLQHVNEVPAHFPAVSISHVCLYTFTWPFRKSLLPQPEVPAESQMNLGCVDAVCRACNTVWMWFLRLSLFSIPLHELGKVKHRWFRQHYPLHCVQCARIPLYPIYTLAVSTPTRLFIRFFAPRASSSPIASYFFFSLSPMQQIKRWRTTTLVSDICPTWQREALFLCMCSSSVKSRWVHKSSLFEACKDRRRSTPSLPFINLWAWFAQGLHVE